MSPVMTCSEAESLLYREALFLDNGEWDSWLALYCEDCVFWMPAWRDETTATSDPDTELSLVYYKGRRNLVDRVWRARSGRSVASTPPPRTLHAVTNIIVRRAQADEADISACFTVHLHDPRNERTHAFFGRSESLVRKADGDWRIATKKILLLNDVIPTVIDFYSM